MHRKGMNLVVAMAVLLLGLGAAAEAAPSYEELSTLNTWKTNAKSTAVGGRLLDIYNSTTNILKTTPRHKQSLYLRGYLYGTIGCTQHAIEDLTRAIEIDPAFAAAYRERGVCYMDQRNFDKAKVDLDRAVQLQPSSGDARFARGKLLLEMDRPSAALSDLAACQALQFQPTLPGELPGNYYNAPAYYLGVCYESMGRPDSAIKHYKASIKSPRLGGSGYIHRYSDQPLDAASRITVYEGAN